MTILALVTENQIQTQLQPLVIIQSPGNQLSLNLWRGGGINHRYGYSACQEKKGKQPSVEKWVHLELNGKQVFPQASTTTQFPTCQALESQSSFPRGFPVLTHPQHFPGCPLSTPHSPCCLWVTFTSLPDTLLILLFPPTKTVSPQRNLENIHVVLNCKCVLAAYVSDEIHFRWQWKCYASSRPTNVCAWNASLP